ncbi:uncharacterized protein N7459_004912 [Penicillium hispanicum]|uniref:uncharacterized protein n=1 Tax=Penicillium hispanicum TaxID=1080232 RepID=UPI00253FEBB5|nr:uncharacterized protein N7459_004912 [Penicillium hispanicum]KAJ5585112.1 hypothetical protein N7459_004912 [Penicillium hispanicum]
MSTENNSKISILREGDYDYELGTILESSAGAQDAAASHINLFSVPIICHDITYASRSMHFEYGFHETKDQKIR